MKRIIYTILALLLISVSAYAGGPKRYVLGFYNVENLFDTYHDDGKNDYEFLPDGKNKWTEPKYEKKLHNIATVIKAMADENKAFHTVLGLSEIENRHVLEDLVSQPEIEAANYQIVHYDGEMFAFFVAHLPSRIGGKGQDLRSRGAEIIYEHSLELMKQYPGIKIMVMGDMNDNPTDESMVTYMHGKETIAEVGEQDFFSPFLSMLKAGYGSLAYRGTWNIYDIILVNQAMANAPKGTLKIQPIVKKKYYGRIFSQPFMTQQEGQYKGTPFRTFSSGTFIGGYSDHYPTYIIVSNK